MKTPLLQDWRDAGNIKLQSVRTKSNEHLFPKAAFKFRNGTLRVVPVGPGTMPPGPGDGRDDVFCQLGHPRPPPPPRCRRLREFRNFRNNERNFVVGAGPPRDIARATPPPRRRAPHPLATPRTPGEAETW